MNNIVIMSTSNGVKLNVIIKMEIFEMLDTIPDFCILILIYCSYSGFRVRETNHSMISLDEIM